MEHRKLSGPARWLIGAVTVVAAGLILWWASGGQLWWELFSDRERLVSAVHREANARVTHGAVRFYPRHRPNVG